MKKKDVFKKLDLNKATVADLRDEEMKAAVGGTSFPNPNPDPGDQVTDHWIWNCNG